MLTVNAAVAATAAEAGRLALPQLLSMLALRTGQPLTAQRLVEAAEQVDLPGPHRDLVEAMRGRWVIGDAATARSEIAALASRFGVDEVMVHPVAGAFAGTDPAGSPAREETLRLLAA